MKKSRIIFIASILALLIPLNSFTQESVSVKVGNIIVADRNLGTKVPQGGLALNYTNDKNHVDHKNSLFKGDYYTWRKAKTACPSGWRLPTKAELEIIGSKMKFSNGRAYLENSAGSRCYFTLVGRSHYHPGMDGFYWTSTKNEINDGYAGHVGGYAWHLRVSTSISGVSSNSKSHGFSVRCVKTVL